MVNKLLSLTTSVLVEYKVQFKPQTTIAPQCNYPRVMITHFTYIVDGHTHHTGAHQLEIIPYSTKHWQVKTLVDLTVHAVANLSVIFLLYKCYYNI